MNNAKFKKGLRGWGLHRHGGGGMQIYAGRRGYGDFLKLNQDQRYYINDIETKLRIETRLIAMTELSL